MILVRGPGSDSLLPPRLALVLLLVLLLRPLLLSQEDWVDLLSLEEGGPLHTALHMGRALVQEEQADVQVSTVG